MFQNETQLCSILKHFMDKLEGKVLIVDDDPGVLQTARFILKQTFREVLIEKDPRKIPFLLNQGFNVILLDMNFRPGETGGKEGLSWLEEIGDTDPTVSTVIITAYGDVELAVEAMKKGAVDFVLKPWENEKFLATIKAAWQLSISRKEIENLKIINRTITTDHEEEFKIIGNSKGLLELQKLIKKVAPTEANVLILGENGTGKELVARSIHNQSVRNHKPFIKVDLGAISSSLFESELFGHLKGSFTDAKQDAPGRFEMASGGTLFLDEIGNIDLQLQSKLLSVIQNREIYRVGSSTPTPVDIRLVSATNLNLEEMVQSGKFREDLYYRLNTFELLVPPLRDRKEDIHALVDHFLSINAKRYRKKLTVTKDELNKLTRYDWPGNIRELLNVVERAVILSDGKSLGLDNINTAKVNMPNSITDSSLDELEKMAIKNALSKYQGNMSKVAAELGVGRSTLYRKMKKYGL